MHRADQLIEIRHRAAARVMRARVREMKARLAEQFRECPQFFLGHFVFRAFEI